MPEFLQTQNCQRHYEFALTKKRASAERGRLICSHHCTGTRHASDCAGGHFGTTYVGSQETGITNIRLWTKVKCVNRYHPDVSLEIEQVHLIIRQLVKQRGSLAAPYSTLRNLYGSHTAPVLGPHRMGNAVYRLR